MAKKEERILQNTEVQARADNNDVTLNPLTVTSNTLEEISYSNRSQASELIHLESQTSPQSGGQNQQTNLETNTTNNSSISLDNRNPILWNHSIYMQCCQAVCRIAKTIEQGKIPVYGTGFIGEILDNNGNNIVGLMTALHVVCNSHSDDVKLDLINNIKGTRLRTYFPNIKYLFESKDFKLTREFNSPETSDLEYFDFDDIVNIDSDILYFNIDSDFVFLPLKDSAISKISVKRKIQTHPLMLTEQATIGPTETAILIQFPGIPFQHCDELCFNCGPIIDEDKFKLYFNISCETGSSGSPLIQLVDNQPKVVGIAIEENSGKCLNYNIATKIACLIEKINPSISISGIKLPIDRPPVNPSECAKKKNIAGEEPVIPHRLYMKAVQAIGVIYNEKGINLGISVLMARGANDFGILSLLEDTSKSTNVPNYSEGQSLKVVFYRPSTDVEENINIVSYQPPTIEVNLSSCQLERLNSGIKIIYFYKIMKESCDPTIFEILHKFAFQISDEFPCPNMDALIITLSNNFNKGFITMTIKQLRDIQTISTSPIRNGILEFYDHLPWSNRAFGGAIFQILSGPKIVISSIITDLFEAINIYPIVYPKDSLSTGMKTAF